MVNKRLLNEELKWYYDENIEMTSIKYNKDLFQTIFDEYNEFGITERLFCCYGLERCCWHDEIEGRDGTLTLECIKHIILRNIKECKKYLYNGRKYGNDRLYIGEKDGCLYVYIYLRDVLKVDYHIWFTK